MKKIALGVSSSIAIFKACEILRLFQKRDFEVQVIMTANATRLISPLLFSSLSGLETITDTFDDSVSRNIGHIALAKEISLLSVAPATANILGKFAAGVADDFLSTFFLTVRCPVLVAPAMNASMYLHPQTQANMVRLKTLGIEFVEPDEGYLACGEEGWGRLAAPEAVVKEALRLIGRTYQLKGKTVLVTAGPTREFMDPVRFLSNPSSGKMGYALAREAEGRGGDVILVSGPTSLIPPAGVRLIKVQTAAEMEKAVLEAFPRVDIVVMAAAVADFRFAETRMMKSGKKNIPETLRIQRIPDILKILAGKKKKQVLVGFAAETDDTLAKARVKMKEKSLDLIVANTVGEGEGFASDENEVHILRPTGKVHTTGRLSKREISRIIFDFIEGILEKKRR